MKNKYIYIVLLILFVIPSFWFLAKPGFITTDDGNWMIIRFSAFYQALRDGQFPVRFLTRLNFGYGYPVANFLYPAFMYLAVPFKIAGLSFINCIKIIIGLSIVSSGLFMFLWLKRFFDEVSCFFASLFYVYAPYHLYDLSKRGSVGELLSLAVFPFVLWQVEREDLVLSSLGLALLIVSHNTLAILFVLAIILYMIGSLYSQKNKKKLLDFYKKTLLFGFGISAFFSLPAILELGNTVFSKTHISDFNTYFADYNLIGITTFIIILVAAGLLVKNNLLRKHKMTVVFIIVALFCIFLASSFSAPFWEFLPVSFIQFPFRLLSLALICVAFLLAFSLSQIPIKFRIGAGVLLVIATMYFSKDYLLPKNFNLQDDSFYSTNEATTTVMDEYMPRWVAKKPSSHFENKVDVVKGEGQVQNITYNADKISFDYVSSSPAQVRINTIYYPGWQAYSDNQPKAIFYDNDQGTMDLKLGGKDQKITLVFGETQERLLADAISIMSLLALSTLVYKNKILNLFKK